jgi:hypothetical protein
MKLSNTARARPRQDRDKSSMKHQTFNATDRLKASLSGEYEDTLAFAASLRAEIDDKLLRRLLWAAWVALGDEAGEEVAHILTAGAGRPLQPLLDELSMSAARSLGQARPAARRMRDGRRARDGAGTSAGMHDLVPHALALGKIEEIER